MNSFHLQNDSLCRFIFSDRVTKENVSLVTRIIESLREQLPSDSIVCCQLDRHDNTYCAMVEASGLKHKFTAIDSDRELLPLFSKLHDSLFHQIRKWRKTRFNHNSQKVKRVLILDDIFDSVALVDKAFRRKGWDVEFATNGRFGIEKILCKPFDLLVIDFQMPGLNGIQTLTEIENRIKHNPTVLEHWQKRELPFITYSGKNFEVSPNGLPHLVCIDNWSKSFELKELERRIRAIDPLVKSVA